MKHLFLCWLLLFAWLPAHADGPPADCTLLARQVRVAIAPADQAPTYTCLAATDLWWYQSSQAHALTIVQLDNDDLVLEANIVATAAIGWHAAPIALNEHAVTLALTEQRSPGSNLTIWYALPQPPNHLPVAWPSSKPCRQLQLRPIVAPLASSVCAAVELQAIAGQRELLLQWQPSPALANQAASIALLDTNDQELWRVDYVTSDRVTERVRVVALSHAVAARWCQQWEGCARYELPFWQTWLPAISNSE
jgi:hypothetical protein